MPKYGPFVDSRSLYRSAFTNVTKLRDEIHRYIQVHNRELAKPFSWTKSAAAIIKKHEKAQEKVEEIKQAAH